MKAKVRKQKLLQLDMMTKMRLQLEKGMRLIDGLKPMDGIRLVIGVPGTDKEKSIVLIDLGLSASTVDLYFKGTFENMLSDMGDTIEAAAKELGGKLN